MLDHLLAPGSSLASTRQLILALAKVPADASCVRELLARSPLDLLAEELTRLKLLGLLGGRLLKLLPAEIPDRFAEEVDGILRIGRQDAVLKQMITWRMLRALEAAGVASVALKGPFLAERLHGDPGARLSHDIDLLVGVRELRNAVAVLEGIGYVRPRLSNALPRLHHILEREDEPPVDLHWRIHWYEASYSEGLLQRSFVVDDIRRPLPEDELISLMLFHARDGFIGLRTPIDVGAWCSIYGAPRGNEALRQAILGNPALAPALAASAIVIERLLGVPLSSQLPPQALRRRFTQAATQLADWSASRGAADADVATHVVDGLLSPSRGLPAFIRRAAFPRLPDARRHRWLRQALHAVWLAARASSVGWELTRAHAAGLPVLGHICRSSRICR